MSHASDALLITALAYYVIGLLLIVVAMNMYAVHPVNRVFIFGHYLTAEGMRVLLRHWPLVSLFGLFIFSCAMEHHLHWLHTHGKENIADVLLLAGWIEAGISVITATVLVWMAAQWGIRKWRHK